jgi:hypothetical protein
VKTKILEAEKDPHLLEIVYRSNPRAFILAFPEAFEEKPDSEIFKIWNERLFYIESPEILLVENEAKEKSYKDFMTILVFCLLGGLLAKLPVFLKWGDYFTEQYYYRNVSFFFMPFIIIYFLILRKVTTKKWILIVELIILAVVYINFLPNFVFLGKIGKSSDTLILACIHLPFFLWFIGGLAFLTPDFTNLKNRLAFLKLNGEIVIYTALILLGGMVLTGITMALFSVSGINSYDWYIQWIVIFGSVSAPIVATSLVLNKGKKFVNLAPLLSKIFTPLFAITLIGFLTMICINLKNPFIERDFLLVINALLLVVVAISTFVVIDRPKDQPVNLFDYITLTLLSSSFVIELIALYAVVIRLTSFGFTPNRVALIGINLILLVHLAGMIINYIRWLLKKTDMMVTLDWIAKFIPIYFYWSAFMVFIFPWLFGLR